MDSPRDSRVRLTAAGILLGVFVAGATLGLTLDRYETPTRSEAGETVRVDGGDRAGAPSEWIIDRMDLTAQQRIQVDSIVSHYGSRMSRFQKEYRPKYQAIVDSTDRALRTLLTPEQTVRYDSLTVVSARWRARRHLEEQAQGR